MSEESGMCGTGDLPLIRWGILGAGKNSGKFASDHVHVPGSTVIAVASRELGRARAFAKKIPSIQYVYEGYDELLQSPHVDIVYIGTVNSEHYGLTKRALLAGKPVLCEKPFTMHPEQTAELIALAREKGLFLAEGIWTRHFPITEEMARRVKMGVYGRPLLAQMDFGFVGNMDPQGRLYDPALGGGALADVGIYPISTAQLYLGAIVDFQANALLAPSGVDTRIVINARHESGAFSLLSAAIDVVTPREATLCLEQAMIRMPCPFWKPSQAIIHLHGGGKGSSPEEKTEMMDSPFPGFGFQYEIRNVNQCLRRGLKECTQMSLEDTMATAILMEKVRKECHIQTA